MTQAAETPELPPITPDPEAFNNVAGERKESQKDLCRHCPRLTANRGGVCTQCLNGHMPTPKTGRKYRTGYVMNRPRPETRKYTDDDIRAIWSAYLSAKGRREPAPAAAAAKKLNLKPSQVQHVLSAYKQGRYHAEAE